MPTIEEIRAQAAARLEGAKRPEVIIMDDVQSHADQVRALTSHKSVMPLLALAAGLAGPSLESLRDETKFIEFDHGQNRTKHRKEKKYHNHGGGNRQYLAAKKARRIRRIAKKSRQYNRRLKRGMRVTPKRI